ncbi:MAG: CBS domain-containing protein [Actinomycetota bacterium]
MQAKDVMSRRVVTARSEATVADIARLMVDNRISAVPIVDAGGRVVGIVSEADLLRRHEIGNAPKPSKWLSLLNEEHVAREFVRGRGRHASDVMTRPVVTVTEDRALPDIASMLEERRIKRVVVVDDDCRPIGVVSRSDVVRGLVAAAGKLDKAVAGSDADIRRRILDSLADAGIAVGQVSVLVTEQGAVDLWGVVRSDARRDAVVAAAQSTAGVREVKDHLVVAPLRLWAD